MIFFTLLISCQGTSNENIKSSLEERWVFTLDTKDDMGKINFIMNFSQETDTSFIAYSRTGAIKDIFGFWKSLLSSIFSNKYKKGAFIHISNGKIDSLGNLMGIFKSAIGTFHFKATLQQTKLEGNIYNKKKKYPFIATPYNKEKLDFDYVNLDKQIKEILQANIYDPHILKRKDWINFFSRLDKIAKNSYDDVDFLFGFLYYIKKVKTSHVFLLKTDPLASYMKDEEGNVSFHFVNQNIGILKFKKFSLSDSVKIDSFYNQLINSTVSNLIIDLRECTGGDFSSMKIAAYLVEKPVYIGYFLGNKYFENNNSIPTKQQIQSLEPFTEGTIKDFFREIETKGILVGKILPTKQRYKGKVFIITDKTTASAAEPLVYFLKIHNKATIVGQNTAGSMLSAKSYSLKEDWYLGIPTADYFTIDGKRLDQIGVAPDIEVETDKAQFYIVNNLLN